MTEETQVINTEAAQTVVESTPAPTSPNTKAAEKKLKEMSRKAKERGKPQNASGRARSEPVTKLNQNWFLGALGLSAILAIGYFICSNRAGYKSRGGLNEAPPELQPFHHPPPQEKEPEGSALGASLEKPNSFDLNSF